MPPVAPPWPLPRIITYYQTHHDAAGKHISILPLLTQPAIAVTHVIVAAVHINADPRALTLNDHAPDHPRFHALWAELRVLQAAGVKVLAMLGGAAPGSFARLDVPDALPPDADDARFEAYYAPLRDLLRARALDGIDLDVEEKMSLAGIVRLVDRLRADFGPGFLITLAPVAAALLDARRNLSGFDYEALEVLRGPQIAWYNAQFYCGWGDLSNTRMYDLVLDRGWPPHKVVVGLVTNPANGSGFVPWHVLSVVLALLRRRPHAFAGVMGWEYFNSLPGDAHRPWEWARHMTALLRQHALPAPPVQPPVPLSAQPPVPLSAEPPVVAAADVVTVQSVDPDDESGDPVEVPRPFDYYSDGRDDE